MLDVPADIILKLRPYDLAPSFTFAGSMSLEKLEPLVSKCSAVSSTSPVYARESQASSSSDPESEASGSDQKDDEEIWTASTSTQSDSSVIPSFVCKTIILDNKADLGPSNLDYGNYNNVTLLSDGPELLQAFNSVVGLPGSEDWTFGFDSSFGLPSSSKADYYCMTSSYYPAQVQTPSVPAKQQPGPVVPNPTYPSAKSMPCPSLIPDFPDLDTTLEFVQGTSRYTSPTDSTYSQPATPAGPAEYYDPFMPSLPSFEYTSIVSSGPMPPLSSYPDLGIDGNFDLYGYDLGPSSSSLPPFPTSIERDFIYFDASYAPHKF